MRRLEQKDRIEAGISLPPDRLISQGPEFVGRLTRKYTIRNWEVIRRPHRSSHLDDGYDKNDTEPTRYVPSIAESLAFDHGLKGVELGDKVYGKLVDEVLLPTSNSYEKRGIKSADAEVDVNEEKHFQDRLRSKHSEPHGVAIDNLIPDSVADKLYGAHFFTAIGHIGSGVMFVNYSDELREIAGGKLSMWSNLDKILKTTIGEQDQGLVAKAELIASSIQKAIGFRPEEIEEHNRLLATRLRGNKSTDHPVRTVLVG